MRVSKLMPRVYFETVEDALQAGAAAVRIVSDEDSKAYSEFLERLSAEEASKESGADDPPHGDSDTEK